jgi:hypothetical protein
MSLAQPRIKSLVAGSFTAIALCFSVAAQAQQATPDIAALKKAHPTWVQVPGQIIRPDCVHELPKGARVEVVGDKITGDVTLGGRVIAHYDACPEPGISTRPAHDAAAPSKPITPGTGNGWVEAVQNDVSSLGSSDNLDWLSGIWTVPAAPAATGGLIYLFNGMEPSSQNWIIQPVLQFGYNGYFGGNYWVIASWMVGPNNYAFYSPAERVNPGDKIYGTTYITSISGSTLHWEVFAEDETNGAYTWITAWTSGLHWTWGYSAVLEAYNISSCSQFPNSDPNVFTSNYAYHGYPSYLAVPGYFTGWENPYWAGPSCGFDPFSYGTNSYLYYY